MLLRVGVRDRCSHDAAGHDVLERPCTASARRRIPLPLWSQTRSRKLISQSSSGGHSGGGTVIMQPIATRSRSLALRLVDRGIYVSESLPPNSTVSPYRTGSRTSSTTSYLRGGAPRFEGDKSHFHTVVQVATAACIAAEYRFKSQAAFHKRTSRGHPHSRKRNRAGRD